MIGVCALDEEQGPLTCKKKHDLPTGGKDNDVNTSVDVKQSSLKPRKGSGKHPGSIFWKLCWIIWLCDNNKPGHCWEWSPLDPQPGLGRCSRGHPWHGQCWMRCLTLTQEPKCFLKTQHWGSWAPRWFWSDEDQDFKVWLFTTGRDLSPCTNSPVL